MRATQKKILLVSMLIFCANTYAQISSNAFFSELTSYPNGNDDPIFYFEDISTAQLTAPTGTSYQWFQYSNSSNTFELLIGENGNTLNSIGEHGYQVQVDDGTGQVTNYYCWSFVPMITDATINIELANCHYLRQLASPNFKNLVYFNHKEDHSSLAVDYDFIYDWSSIPLGPIENETTQSVQLNAPTEDTEYTVTISNKFSSVINDIEANNNYIAIAVEAQFTWEPLTNADNEIKEGSTPMEVRFHAEEYDDEILSKGKITDWEWTFGEAGKDYVPNPIFTFQKAGEYPVTLIVRNLNTDDQCEDISDAEIFTANEMVVKVPGAFTPFSSPTKNDEFKVLYRSVSKFKMVIYNRWGRVVYNGTNPDEGWNGRINGKKAEPGVYFYRIEADGFNKGESTKLEGALHLIIKND